MNGNYLEHYGVKGMRWGVRKARITSKSDSHRSARDYKSTQRKQTAKRIARKTATSIATSVALTMTINSILNSSDGTRYVSSGKSYVNSYMKSHGKKKISNFSDHEKSWADYAWEEVQKSGWG